MSENMQDEAVEDKAVGQNDKERFNALLQNPPKMRLLSREDILAQRDKLQVRVVHVEEWGGDVRLRELTAHERTQVEMSMTEQTNKGQVRAKLAGYALLRGKVLALAIVGEDNAPLFTEDDIFQLNQLGAGPIEQLFNVAAQMSGLSASDLDNIVGESVSTPNGDSRSDSR